MSDCVVISLVLAYTLCGGLKSFVVRSCSSLVPLVLLKIKSMSPNPPESGNQHLYSIQEALLPLSQKMSDIQAQVEPPKLATLLQYQETDLTGGNKPFCKVKNPGRSGIYQK